MTVVTETFGIGNVQVPAVVFTHERPRAYAIVVHGYGGCKEEALGLAWRIAKEGLTVAAIDLRGHGENERLYDTSILEDVDLVVRHLKRSGKVLAVGHSLGGRLCLLSQADCKIGISPALGQSFGQATVNLITTMRAHRVREERAGINFDTLNILPLWTIPNIPP